MFSPCRRTHRRLIVSASPAILQGSVWLLPASERSGRQSAGLRHPAGAGRSIRCLLVKV